MYLLYLWKDGRCERCISLHRKIQIWSSRYTEVIRLVIMESMIISPLLLFFFPHWTWGIILYQSYVELLQSKQRLSATKQMLLLLKTKSITVITLPKQNWQRWAGNGPDYISWMLCATAIQLAFCSWQRGGSSFSWPHSALIISSWQCWLLAKPVCAHCHKFPPLSAVTVTYIQCWTSPGKQHLPSSLSCGGVS